MGVRHRGRQGLLAYDRRGILAADGVGTGGAVVAGEIRVMIDALSDGLRSLT